MILSEVFQKSEKSGSHSSDPWSSHLWVVLVSSSRLACIPRSFYLLWVGTCLLFDLSSPKARKKVGSLACVVPVRVVVRVRLAGPALASAGFPYC